MLTDVAIIGGTGVGDALTEMAGQAVHIPTPAGQLAGRLIPHPSGPIFVASRHSSGHKVPPHMVNYEALALGLKRAGIQYCFSTAAVGSLRSDWPVGTLASISDFVDLSGRRNTLYSDRTVHRDFSEPFSHRCAAALVQSGETHGVRVEQGGVYVCENGPRYETPQEVRLIAHLGDVVGMTAASEAILFREAGIEYGCLAVVTNPAAGLGALPLDHGDVAEKMRKSAGAVLSILLTSADLVRKQQ